MKKSITVFIGVLLYVSCISQQTGPVLLRTKKTAFTSIKIATQKDAAGKELTVETKSETTQKEEAPILILYGIGNFNQESFTNLNSSGKASFLFIPITTDKRSLRINMSVNKNATNNDSLLASTLLFPEIGNHSFLGTIEMLNKIKKGGFQTDNFLSAFFEFSYKKIKIDETDTSSKTSFTKSFATVNFTVGGKLIFAFEKNEFAGSFAFIPYISYLNIPDEDKDDYKFLAKKNFRFINNNDLRDDLFSIGMKTIFEINSFQLFADFRHVLRNERVSAVELRGLKVNIGVVFNASILSARL
jgi:hypothetical protein